MTHFRRAPHSSEPRVVIEVWEDQQMIAVIYPKDRGVKIVSKYIENRPDLVVVDLQEPPALLVNVWDRHPIEIRERES